jgi:DNA-binding IclR family transcriptional regulator
MENSNTRVTPTGVYGLLRRSPLGLNVADIADDVDTGIQRAHVIVKALVAAGLAREDRTVVPLMYSAIEVPSLSARRKRLKYARELWQETRPAGNSQAREEIMRFKSGKY